MKRRVPKNAALSFVAWAALIVFSAAIALAQEPGSTAGPSPEQGQAAAGSGQRTDGQIEMDVVNALDAAPALKNDLITAATIQSEVTLSGTVSSAASKQLAGSIAAGVQGVTKVQNNLKVGNPQAAPEYSVDQGSSQGSSQGSEQGYEPNSSTTPQDEDSAAGSPYAQQENAPPQPPQPQYPPQPPQPGPSSAYAQQSPYAQAPRPYAQQSAPVSGPVTLAPGTLLQVRTSEPVDSKHAVPGEPVQFVVIQDVTLGGVLAVPRGAVVHGIVTESRNVGSGPLAGNSTLSLELISLDLGGHNYTLQTDPFRVKAPNKAGRTVGSAVTGGLFGTILGCAIGRGAGCAIGAGAGIAAGTAAGAATSGPPAWIPAEALVSFHLTAPLTVQPVSPQEAARLAQGLYPGGPRLYRRQPYASPYGYGAGYGYGPAYYAYPAPYYVPYTMVGGVYVWR